MTKIVDGNNFEWVWDELQSKKCFQRQSVAKYLTLTLVFMSNSTPREKFNHNVLDLEASTKKIFILWGGWAMV